MQLLALGTSGHAVQRVNGSNRLGRRKGRRIDIDTTGKTPQQSLDELLLKSEPLITAGELAIRSMPIPDGDYEVVYENGIRKTVSA